MSKATNIVHLLNMIGNPDYCKECGRSIWWVTTKHARVIRVTEDGNNHFPDCEVKRE